MSHKASAWLFEIPAEAMSHSEFRVMAHLCDAHNSKRDPDTACFPSQERLRIATGLSNGGLNNALNALEQAGLIHRRRQTEPGTAIRRTYHILGCDFAVPLELTPNNGVRANSTFGEANSTFQGGKLHPGGDYPVSNLKIEPSRANGDSGHENISRSKPTRHDEKSKVAESDKAHLVGNAYDPETGIRALAEWINAGKYVAPSLVTNTKRDALLASGLVTRERLRELQVY